MNILQGSKKLVQEKLMVLRCEIIVRLYNLMKVRLHQLENNIYVPELPSRGRKHNVFDLDDIGVAKQPKELDLPKNAGGVRYMLKHIIDLLDCNSLSSVGVGRSPNHAVTSFANDLVDLVSARLAILGEKFCLNRVLNRFSKIEKIA